jgi:membrane protease YdiL (CAAX protease family)
MAEIQNNEQGEDLPKMFEQASNFYPTIRQSFNILGYLLLITITLGMITAILSPRGNMSSLIILLVYSVSFILTIRYASRKKGSDQFSFGPIPGVSYLLIVPATMALFILYEPIVNLIPVPDWARSFFDLEDSDPFNLFSMIIAAPLLEEILFRGIILDGFLKRYSPGKAIVWSSLLFGLIHLNPWQFIAAFAIGLATGWMYWKSRSLLPCIIIHFVTNASAVAMAKLAKDSWMPFQQFVGDDSIYFSIFASAIVVLIITYFSLKKILALNRI